MSTRHKKKPDAEDNGAGDKARPSDGGSGHARKPFDESMWLRDANGRFAGSVKQSSPFTSQERIELQDYAEGNYQQLNSYLANPNSVRPSLAVELEKQAVTLDSAIGKSVLTQDTVVYRGFQHRGLAKQAESVVGKTINPHGFLSTSTNSQVARDFAGYGDGSVVLAIKAKAGAKAAYMDQFATSNNARENELLFPRDSKIRITGVDRTRSPPVILGEFE